MYLKHLSLANYRNYVRLEQELPERTILVQGDNAQGKTNLLEAIYYLATTRSPIVGSDRHLVNWGVAGEPLPFARVVGDVARTGESERIEITLVREGQAEGRLVRRLRVNGVEKRAVDLLGRLNVVLFLPQDIDLVCGAPALRRRYLDVTLCQVDRLYTRHLQRYNRVLLQRNSLLRRLRERHDDPAQLSYWDEQLARWGALVAARRRQAVKRLETAAATIQPELTGGTEQLALRYEAAIPLPEAADAPAGPGPDDAPPALVDAALAALRRARPRDLGAGVTTVGPHRDELRFLVGGVDIGLLGSRGQQRTVALALKLAEVRFMEGETGESPVLLLDDVMSELDRARGQYLLRTVDAARQVIITASDLAMYPHEFLERAVLWRVKQGVILYDTAS
ncbi:MAG TPA: DNA replication/repair protein RecF [Anaerolineae bacterium]|nr:DNA replication/repair protein RecF [Anaerolineae bacterium]HOQ97231.1 DNA replication/repair protein RecF [Anaerolineae bacterium]HPL26456.1 DNA replication/repair protein RecF [Anaerolineae bacterium]